MNELLSNPAVQLAAVALIVTALNALVAWIKIKFPTQAALVESNWCYLQPAVEAAIAAGKKASSNGTLTGGVAATIVLSALSDFGASYKKLEGKAATDAEMDAARTEITTALARETGV